MVTTPDQLMQVRTSHNLPDRVTGNDHRIEALERELHDLRALVEQHLRRDLGRTDRMALLRLLPAIVGTYGSETFTARDVTTDPAVAIRTVLGNRTTKSLGKLLGRAADAGAVVDGWLVQRDVPQVNVAGWRVVRAIGLSAFEMRHGRDADWQTQGQR